MKTPKSVHDATTPTESLAGCTISNLLQLVIFVRSFSVLLFTTFLCLKFLFSNVKFFYSLSGLSIHPDQPFILASCSRDSTVRLWSTYEACAPMLPILSLAGYDSASIFSTPGKELDLLKDSLRIYPVSTHYLPFTIQYPSLI